MSARDDGGPAFPSPPEKWGKLPPDPHRDGMTLRDYFAAKAVNGLISNPEFKTDAAGDEIPHEIARLGYQLADAMLTERAKS